MGLEILLLLIPVTFFLALLGLGLFLWAIHSGQLDDLETPAIRAIFDDGTAFDEGSEKGEIVTQIANKPSESTT